MVETGISPNRTLSFTVACWQTVTTLSLGEDGSMPRSIPPAGNPIMLRELSAVARCIFSPTPAAAAFKRQIAALTDVPEVFLLSTGRAAMSFLLRTLRQQCQESDRTRVVVPSYTCYSVAASIVAAGLEVMVCDIDEATLSYDLSQLESIDHTRILAVVSANLYGIPDELDQLESITAANGVFLIDDAAQSLGATLGNRQVGTFGDAGLFSLDKGKNITSINGGVLVTGNSQLAENLGTAFQKLPELHFNARLANYVKLVAYAVFLHPHTYWIPKSIPVLGLGRTPYDEEIEESTYHAQLSPIAIGQLSRLEMTNDFRRTVAKRYEEKLRGLPGVRLVDVGPDATPVYLRYPIRIVDPEARREFLIRSQELGTSASYPASIAAIPQLRDRIVVHNDKYDAGKAVAGQIVTLPTHGYVEEGDIESICNLLVTLR